MVKKTKFLRNLLVICIAAFLTSCASKDKIHYLKDVQATNNLQDFQNTLEPDDNLIITITAKEPELARDFNMLYLNMQSTEMRNVNDQSLYTYLIDQRGEIDFPVLGKVKLAGLTRVQAEEKIKGLLKDYIVDPGVNLRVLNFKVSVLGEVARPGTIPVAGDRITLLEALGSAGDMTIYGQRKEVLVLREKEGVQTVATVDISKADFITSPYYYLAHNDVVYVKPNQTRVNSSVIGPNLTVGLSALTLLVTVISLSVR